METVLGIILSYFISLAANLRSEAMAETHREKLQQRLKKEADALQNIRDRRSLREQLRLVGTEAARLKAKAGLEAVETRLFGLLIDEVFQEDMARWLLAWRPEERRKAEAELSKQMVKALQKGGAGNSRIEDFKASYFERIEKAVSGDPILSNWRLSLALHDAFERLDELEAVNRQQGKQTRQEVRAQHEETRQQAAEISARQAQNRAAQFSDEEQGRAVERYRELALESCDIIDLANLPESDRHVATRKLELRRLYVPLRVKVEITGRQEPQEAELEKIEKRREYLLRQGIGKGEGRDEEEQRAAPGERLAESGRLVLLGDPGAGKTTLVRWLATAYLLRLKRDPAFENLPDVKTLPDREWLPIVVRCRDLGESCQTGTIDDVLAETFRKAQMSDRETAALQAVMRKLLAEGRAILLVDGLDEISEVGLRARFCQQIERLHIAFPKAPMLVTSRIVGYREMHYRIGRGFEHVTVAEFSTEDKDEFARRWCEITELPERSQAATEELINAIHSSDRIERLTSNPMLLTTLALVKRKVGKLPNRRADLYWEAVLVLLNWRAEVDTPLDRNEAIPQLEYLAFEMCRQGVQRLRQDEILELLERMRPEYPNIRVLKNHEPGDFLQLLERRTGILIAAGEVRHKGRPVPVFEFRHLTFQEYLAALALVDGRFPGRDRTKTLAQCIAPLAGQVEKPDKRYPGRLRETAVTETWREVLQLCAACCGDDDVDDVLLAILTPLKHEDLQTTARPRAVLASLCLADEPNVSDRVANQVLQTLARHVKEGDGEGTIMTPVDAAAVELVGSEWERRLLTNLIEEFCRREPLDRLNPGGVAGMVAEASAPKADKELHRRFEQLVAQFNGEDDAASIEAALSIMQMAYKDKARLIPGMIEGLLVLLDKNGPSAEAGAWALFWLGGGSLRKERQANKEIWTSTPKEIERLTNFVADPTSDIEAVRFSIYILGNTKAIEAVEALIPRLNDENGKIRGAAIWALVEIGDSRAVEPLMARLDDEREGVRKEALVALVKICEEEVDLKLISSDIDAISPWLDPRQPVGKERVKRAAEEIKMPEDEVRRRYERLAEKYNLKLAWK
jgi:hypothetical protein